MKNFPAFLVGAGDSAKEGSGHFSFSVFAFFPSSLSSMSALAPAPSVALVVEVEDVAGGLVLPAV